MTTRNPFYWITVFAQITSIALLWATPSFANDKMSASQTSAIRMIKTSAPKLATSESLLTTGLNDSLNGNLNPSFCLDIDLASHRIAMDDQVTLTSQQSGHTVEATIHTQPAGTHYGAQCGGSTIMVTADISKALNADASGLYTGSLYVIISPE